MAGPRILIVKLSAIGDCLHATPVIEALRQTFPDAHLGWVVHPHCRPVLEGNPALNQIHEWDRKNLWGSLGALGKELRAARYETVLDLQGLLKSALVCRISGAQSWGPSEAREGAKFLYHHRIPALPNEPIQLRYLKRAAAIGAKWETAPRMHFPFSEADLDFAQGLLHGIREPKVILNPSAGKEFKQWSPKCFAEVGRELLGRGCRPIITGAPADRALADAILEGCPSAIDLCGKTNLKQLAALLSLVDLFIGGDTGPMHMAQASGCRVIALFGPTNARVLGPQDPLDTILESPNQTMDGISVESVLKATEKYIAVPLSNVKT